MVGRHGKKLVARLVAVSYRTRWASGVSPHQYIIRRIAHDKRLDGSPSHLPAYGKHRLGSGFRLLYIIAGDEHTEQIRQSEVVCKLLQ